MQIVTVSLHDLQLMLDRQAERIINSIPKQKEEAEPTPGKRIVDADTFARKYKIPKPSLYGKVHRKQLPALRMPGSRKLYFDLDVIESLLSVNH